MHSVQMTGFREKIRAVAQMLKEHHEPRQIALGVAIGAFIAILPLYGFHTILCVLAAILIPRANRLSILLGSSISIPPTVATITWTGYDIGRFLLVDMHYPPLSWDYIRHFQISKIGEFYFPLFAGSFVLAVICSGILYWATFFTMSYFRKKAGTRYFKLNLL